MSASVSVDRGRPEAVDPRPKTTRMTHSGHVSDEFRGRRAGGLSNARSNQESLAGLGQADAARRAQEERRADASLECAYRLADRRWRHPQLRGCSAKAAVLGNAQERLHAVERALPDCEVLLHALSTLSRIVVRRKRSYIWPANRRSADAETQKPRQRPQALKEPSP
jgi:hypothetical protein